MTVKFEYTGKLSDGRFFDTNSTKRVIVELDDNDLSVPELLEEFMNFMKAIGYNFDLGDHLDVVNDFKTEQRDNFKIDFSAYDDAQKASQPIVDGDNNLNGTDFPPV